MTESRSVMLDRSGRSGDRPGGRRETWTGWLLASPALVLLAVFLITPLILGFWLGLTDQRLVSPNPAEFVGLRNYEELLRLDVLALEPVTDASGQVVVDESGHPVYPQLREFTRDQEVYPQYYRMQEWMQWTVGDQRVLLLARDVVFMKALVNTILFALVVVPAQAIIGLGLALLVNKTIRGITFYRTVLFLPVVISMVVVSQLWVVLYNEQSGLINALLGAITLGAVGPVDWLGDPATALGSIMAMSVWQGVGFHMIIWLAGLQIIPRMLYEVARIDGAGRWAEFRHVTWPGLHHTAVFVFVIATIQAFGLFTQIDRMTGGGPLDTTQAVIFQAVQRGFGKQDVAMGSAISMVFFALVLAVTLAQRYLTRERGGTAR